MAVARNAAEGIITETENEGYMIVFLMKRRGVKGWKRFFNRSVSERELYVRRIVSCWRGNRIKERTVRLAIKRALEKCGIHDEDQVELVLALARNQNDY